MHALSKTQIRQFLDYICSTSEHTRIHFLWRPTLSDPSDDMLLELAVAVSAKHIVTFNISDFKGIKKFNIEAITPKHFLQLIGELP